MKSEFANAPLDLWWAVPSVLAGMSLPFVKPERHDRPAKELEAFDDELPLLWSVGIRAIVCLLNMPSVSETYTAAGFAFLLLPIPNGGIPTSDQWQNFLAFMTEQRALGHPVAVHCEAGIGRTGVMLAAYLICQGASSESALASVRALRKGAVETQQQWEFLQELAANQQV